jgi:malonate transporter MadM subunit
MQLVEKFIEKNGLIFAFLIVGIIMFVSEILSDKLTRKKLPAAAISIILGLVLAYFGGAITGGEKGISDIKIFAGIGTLGGSMFRDFAIVSTAFGASLLLMKKTGWIGIVSLFVGISFSFVSGVALAYMFGYKDVVSLCTIGAGACTYIVGPVTGAALGASSEVMALSIAAGVIKAIFVAIGTPFIAKAIGLNNPHSAMIFGGMIGTNTGVMAGLAATDEKLVPYGAMTATFYTGLGCLLCPSLFYMLMNFIFV